MEGNGRTSWRLVGEELVHCNCDWSCPCQFNANPTQGFCEAIIGYAVRDGHFGETSMDGVRFVEVVSWPGPIHEGDGHRMLIVDEASSDDQRAAVEALVSGAHGGAYFEIFASVIPNEHGTTVAPIDFEIDREARTGAIRIDGIAESRAEPIRNPVTGDEHRIRIVIPEGFEYKEAEIGSTALARVTAEDPLSLDLEGTYAQLNEFDWTNT